MSGRDPRPGPAPKRRSDAYFSVSSQVARKVARGEAAEAIGVLRRELARIRGLEEEEGRRFLYGLLAVCHSRAADPEGVRLVLEEMEAELRDCAETALKLAEGYLILLGESGPARRWALRAAELAGADRNGDGVERRSRARTLEGRAALQDDDLAGALEALEGSELPDPELAEELLGAGAPASRVGTTLRRGLAAHEERERTGAVPSARSDELRRILRRLEHGGKDRA